MARENATPRIITTESPRCKKFFCLAVSKLAAVAKYSLWMTYYCHIIHKCYRIDVSVDADKASCRRWQI